MSKQWLIIKREYLSRVKKKSFILTTLLTPIGFALFFIGLTFIMTSKGDKQRIWVKDESQLMGSIPDGEGLHFTSMPPDISLPKALELYKTKKYNGIIHFSIEKNKDWNNAILIDYYSDSQLGINTKSYIERIIAEKIAEAKIDSAKYDRKILESFKTQIVVNAVSTKKGEEGKRKGSVVLATGIGMLMGFLIYIVVLIYGSMVMRAVMEEKNSRVNEILVSSVRPFQLMLGKVIGVGMVGLTQFAIWLIFIPILQIAVGLVFGSKLSSMQSADQLSKVDTDTQAMLSIMDELQTLSSYNYTYIIIVFILFFLMGYLLYASLFAALGSAIGEDSAESQSITLPVTIPVILSFYIAIAVVQNPNSSLAHWSSFVPFFSPVVVPARLAFHPPFWEVALSLFILFITCIGVIWLAGRIYRVGILMYGKKVTLKELSKWFFYKD